jgi:hypothetical protein
MVDPIVVVVDFLSNCAPLPGRDSLTEVIAALSPTEGFNLLDHIQGGNDLPQGWRVDKQGPVVLVGIQGPGSREFEAAAFNVPMTIQCYASTDEDASKVAGAVVDSLDERSGRGFTYARTGGVPQTIPDRTSEWRIGLVYFMVHIRNT